MTSPLEPKALCLAKVTAGSVDKQSFNSMLTRRAFTQAVTTTIQEHKDTLQSALPHHCSSKRQILPTQRVLGALHYRIPSTQRVSKDSFLRDPFYAKVLQKGLPNGILSTQLGLFLLFLFKIVLPLQ